MKTFRDLSIIWKPLAQFASVCEHCNSRPTASNPCGFACLRTLWMRYLGYSIQEVSNQRHFSTVSAIGSSKLRWLSSTNWSKFYIIRKSISTAFVSLWDKLRDIIYLFVDKGWKYKSRWKCSGVHVRRVIFDIFNFIFTGLNKYEKTFKLQEWKKTL